MTTTMGGCGSSSSCMMACRAASMRSSDLRRSTRSSSISSTGVQYCECAACRVNLFTKTSLQQGLLWLHNRIHVLRTHVCVFKKVVGECVLQRYLHHKHSHIHRILDICKHLSRHKNSDSSRNGCHRMQAAIECRLPSNAGCHRMQASQVSVYFGVMSCHVRVRKHP